MKFKDHRSPCHLRICPPYFPSEPQALVESLSSISSDICSCACGTRVDYHRTDCLGWAHSSKLPALYHVASLVHTPFSGFKNLAYPQPIANCAATTTSYIIRSSVTSTNHRMSFKFKYILYIQPFSTIRRITHEQLIRFTDYTHNNTVPWTITKYTIPSYYRLS